MFRQFDWQCRACGDDFAEVVSFPQGDPFPPDSDHLDDPLENGCDCDAVCDRMPSIPAAYMQKPMFPRVGGGRFDTMGQKALPKLPELRDGASFEEAKHMFRTKEYRDRREERNARKVENRMKKWRAGLAANGERIDLRTDKLAGDPKDIAS